MLGRRHSKPPERSPRTLARTPHGQSAAHPVAPRPPGTASIRSKRPSLWYALYFPTLPATAAQADTPLIAAVAQYCQHISDYISVDGDDALVLEIGRSLRYFGGLARIRQRLETGITAQLSHSDFCQAVAPSASASLLMARAGHEAAIGRPEDLRSRLGSIPTSALAIDLPVRRKLAKCGLLYLRDIWRLPLPELRIRFGRHFSDHIEQCLGLRPEVRPRWQALPDYHDHYDADHGLHSLQQIVFACERLLHRLETFLRKNHLCTDQLIFHMDYGHTNDGHTGANTHRMAEARAGRQQSVTVNVRKPERNARLFLLLLETQLSDITFAGIVVGITLQANHFSHFRPEGGVQQKTAVHAAARSPQLLDTLAARLGSHAVQRLLVQQDYCPEFATRMVPYLTPMADDSSGAWGSAHTSVDNPCWLLQPPRPLPIRNQQLHYLSPLTLLRGPRRIETRWWQDKGIRRDYYVAANAQGNLLWIYQDLACNTSTGQRQTGWYLHGLFG